MTNVAFNRLTRDARKEAVLLAAVKLSEKPGGFSKFQRADVAAAAGCSASLINHYFSNLDGLRKAIVMHSISTMNLRVLGQALACGHHAAKRLDGDLKRRALAHAVA